MTIFRNDTAQDAMVSTLLEKKRMLESLHADEITPNSKASKIVCPVISFTKTSLEKGIVLITS